VTPLVTHWRTASAAAVLVLAGSSAWAVVWLTDVWHRPGAIVVDRMTAPMGTASPDAAPRQGVSLLISPPQLAVLAARYRLDYAGRGVVAGRRAVVVTVARPGGALAGRCRQPCLAI
jgi:hypothetical protein